jgi:hypothetical protein
VEVSKPVFHIDRESASVGSSITGDYRLRLWVVGEHAPYRHLSLPIARLKFMSSSLGLIDLLAVLHEPSATPV